MNLRYWNRRTETVWCKPYHPLLPTVCLYPLSSEHANKLMHMTHTRQQFGEALERQCPWLWLFLNIWFLLQFWLKQGWMYMRSIAGSFQLTSLGKSCQALVILYVRNSVSHDQCKWFPRIVMTSKAFLMEPSFIASMLTAENEFNLPITFKSHLSHLFCLFCGAGEKKHSHLTKNTSNTFGSSLASTALEKYPEALFYDMHNFVLHLITSRNN